MLVGPGEVLSCPAPLVHLLFVFPSPGTVSSYHHSGEWIFVEYSCFTLLERIIPPRFSQLWSSPRVAGDLIQPLQLSTAIVTTFVFGYYVYASASVWVSVAAVLLIHAMVMPRFGWVLPWRGVSGHPAVLG